MKVLRDFYCLRCGSTIKDCWVDRDVLEGTLFCNACRQATMHHTVCNGGTKSRWRFFDFSDDPTNYFGQTSHSVSVVDEDTGEDVKDIDGGVIHERAQFADTDVKAEKRDRAEHGVKQQRGKNPIYLT